MSETMSRKTEQNNIKIKFAIVVIKDGFVVGHLMQSRTEMCSKTFFSYQHIVINAKLKLLANDNFVLIRCYAFLVY